MNRGWQAYGGGEEEESDEESRPVVENLNPPKGVSESFCQCVDALKWKLYATIVLGPELNTAQAQQNQLLEAYEGQLEQMYAFLSQALKGSIKESTLSSFPASLRHPLLQCARDIQKMRHGGGGALRYTDRIPYEDYLVTQLRVYPYLHYRGQSQDSS